MKKALSVVLVLVLALSMLAGCGGESAAPAGDLVTINVGATSTPHAEVLNALKEDMAAKGFDLNVIEYTDYVIPNTAVESGELDANYFQHQPYLDDFNAENDTHIVTVAKVHYEPMGLYAGKTSSLEELADGATIAVPNDTTNEARALGVLVEAGLITLADGAGLAATPKDIVDNPKNIKFYEVEAAAVARSLSDVDFAVVNGNYALEAGLKCADALAVESSESEGAQTYANILCVKEGNEENEAVKALVECITSDTCRNFINETYEGAVVPVF